jgi:uncharacterized protein
MFHKRLHRKLNLKPRAFEPFERPCYTPFCSLNRKLVQNSQVQSATVSEYRPRNLRFNFGFLIEASSGTSREIELDYPSIRIEDELNLTPLTGKFQAVRNSKGIYLSGLLKSTIETECARCLEPVTLPITIQLADLFYYPPSEAPEGEFFVGDDGFLDLAPLVRQLSLLEIPMQPFCREDCKGLCVVCGQNLNEGSCDCVVDEIDPRFETLRGLLDSEN